MSVASAFESQKHLRGTKRACPSCAVRFYDLARDPVVCPSCGNSYTPEAEPAAYVPSVEKGGRRAKPFKYPQPAAAAEPAEAPEAAAAEDGDEPASVVADDDVVLEQEPDDASVEDLIDHDVEEPKDR